MEDELQTEKAEKNQLANSQMSMFNQNMDENLVQFQLDLKEDLDKIYHLLNGHQPTYHEGEVVWEQPDNDDLRPFNKYGVQILMTRMSFYLNRNTLLSNYDQETINWKVLSFGIEISDLIYNKFEEMGFNTAKKISLYPMIVTEMVDTVHSAYQRSLKGMERESLRKNLTVTQSQPIGGYAQPRNGPAKPQDGKRFSLVNPTTWF